MTLVSKLNEKYSDLFEAAKFHLTDGRNKVSSHTHLDDAIEAGKKLIKKKPFGHQLRITASGKDVAHDSVMTRTNTGYDHHGYGMPKKSHKL